MADNPTPTGWWPKMATMTPGQSAAVSEGFCEPCRTRLNDPVQGRDGATSVLAAQCPNCRVVYFFDANFGSRGLV